MQLREVTYGKFRAAFLDFEEMFGNFFKQLHYFFLVTQLSLQQRRCDKKKSNI